MVSYKGTDAWAVAADALISQSIGNIHNSKIVISGCNNPSLKLAQRLSERGARVTLWDENRDRLNKIVYGFNLITEDNLIDGEVDKLRASTDADVMIGFSIKGAVITKEMLEQMNPDGLVIDSSIGSILPEGVQYQILRGL